MTKLILHIGSEKTGSTALQHYLAHNKDRLLKKNFFIPSFLGSIDHRWLPVIMYPFERKDDLTDSCLGLDDVERNKLVAHKKTEFASKVAQHKDQTWIISSEHLQARLRTKQEIEKLKAFLFDYFEDINVICYVRKPIEAVVSLWSTAAKCGHCWEELPSPGSHIDRLCNHRHTDELWSNSFGKSFNMRLYAKTELCNGNIIDDFSKYADIDPLGLDSLSKNYNPSLSEAAIKTISFINKKVNSSLKIESEKIDRESLMGGVEAAFSSLPRFAPSYEETKAYCDYYSESDEYILKKYFPEKKELWTASRKAGNKVESLDGENHAVAYEQFANFIVDVWLQERRKQAELELQINALDNEIRSIKSSKIYHYLKLPGRIRHKLISVIKNKS